MDQNSPPRPVAHEPTGATSSPAPAGRPLDAFAQVERIYRPSVEERNRKKKFRSRPVSFDQYLDLIDISRESSWNGRVDVCSPQAVQSSFFDPVDKVYTLSQHEGFYIVPNPFSEEQQRDWVWRCIFEYPIGNPTNISNLDQSKKRWTSWQPDQMKKLRWTSVGYHFQWTGRFYDDSIRGPFPTRMKGIVRDLASLVGCSTIEAEAAIINYYPRENCIMGGHVDDSEEDMSKPVVSLSFGNSAVFVIGDTSRNVTPTAVLVHSGDVVIMSGKSRYCFHSVPRVFGWTSPSYLLNWDDFVAPDAEAAVDVHIKKQFLIDYMKNTRVNMNCRQVKFE